MEAKPLAEVLIEHSRCNRGWVKRRLIDSGLLVNKCALCGISEWRDAVLVMRLDHVNGVNDDYRIANLRLLCPNCDSQTDTYCGRNMARAQPRICACGRTMHSDSLRCRRCALKLLGRGHEPKIAWPTPSALFEMVQSSSFIATGKCLGVSDSSIKKHLRRWIVLPVSAISSAGQSSGL